MVETILYNLINGSVAAVVGTTTDLLKLNIRSISTTGEQAKGGEVRPYLENRVELKKQYNTLNELNTEFETIYNLIPTKTNGIIDIRFIDKTILEDDKKYILVMEYYCKYKIA